MGAIILTFAARHGITKIAGINIITAATNSASSSVLELPLGLSVRRPALSSAIRHKVRTHCLPMPATLISASSSSAK
ncbi:MAG: hypothetical protein U5N55_09940 [Cypionkella sp.]|nr:hypothetical protein [Cypionkella sp.]